MREASLWTIKLLRELDPPLVEHELAILDELPTARRQTSMNKSPIRVVGSMVSARDNQSKKGVVAKQDVAAFESKPLTDRASSAVEQTDFAQAAKKVSSATLKRRAQQSAPDGVPT